MHNSFNLQEIVADIDIIFNTELNDISQKLGIKQFTTPQRNKGPTFFNIHYYYPLVFYDDFKEVDIELHRLLSIYGRLYLIHILQTDRILDDRSEVQPVDLFKSFLLYEKATEYVRKVFLPDSKFWEYYEKYHMEYINAILLEKTVHYDKIMSYPLSDYEAISKGKSAMAKTITTGLAILNGSPELIPYIDNSQDNFYIGYQFYDDLRDWKEDLKNRQFSLLLTRVLKGLGYVGKSDRENIPDLEEIGRYMYYSGLAEWALKEAEHYYNKSLSVLQDLSFLTWRKIILDYRKKCIDLKRDLALIKNRILKGKTYGSKENLLPPPKKIKLRSGDNNVLLSAILDSFKFLKSNQKTEGFWEDLHLDVGTSTEWATGYVGLSMVKACQILKEDTDFLSQAAMWLVKKQHQHGGWGFNENSGADADSTSTCLLFLQAISPPSINVIQNGIQLLLENQNSDGGFSTYSFEEIKREKEVLNSHFAGPLDIYKGWCSSDTEVTSISVLALLQTTFFTESKILDRAIDFLIKKQQPEGFWYSYWSNGKLLGTYYSALTLKQFNPGEAALEKAVHWLYKNQLSDGGWCNGFRKISTPYDTALAVSTLLLFEDRKVRNHIKLAIEWLLKNQRIDGSWESFPFLTIPKPWDENQLDSPNLLPATRDHNRLFTTANVLQALIKYYWYLES